MNNEEPISQLPRAKPLGGLELVEIAQNGANFKTTVGDIAGLSGNGNVIVNGSNALISPNATAFYTANPPPGAGGGVDTIGANADSTLVITGTTLDFTNLPSGSSHFLLFTDGDGSNLQFNGLSFEAAVDSEIVDYTGTINGLTGQANGFTAGIALATSVNFTTFFSGVSTSGTTNQFLFTDGDGSNLGGVLTTAGLGSVTQAHSSFLDAISGVSPIGDGTYTVGLGVTTNGTITVQAGIITAIQQAS